MTGDGNKAKKSLTRNQILKANNIAKEYQLPSGKTVHTTYLTVGMVIEIERSVELLANGEKAHLFIQKVIECMLGKTNQKEYQTFSAEDRRRLLEIAVEEWGCENEYEQFIDIADPELRFYRAIRVQEKALSEQLSKLIETISPSLTTINNPLLHLQNGYKSSLKEMLNNINGGSRIGEIINNLNTRVIEQMGDIFRFQSPILSVVDELTKNQSSSFASTKNSILESVGGMVTSYQNLMKDILPVERFVILPDSVRYFPTIEMHNTSVVAAHYAGEVTFEPREDIITPEITGLLVWLESLDVSFPNMLRGAELTMYSQNPDHCRHFASSHRELSTHVLHLLAPDNEVKKWTKDHNHYDKDGKPTRKARLKYIARNHNNNTFVDFVIRDFENQMILLNADEHRKIQGYSNQELRTLHKRFLSMLGFLWEIVSSHS